MWSAEAPAEDVQAIVRALARLAPNTRITVTVEVGELAKALESVTGGPEYGDAQDAEKWVGFYSAK